MANFWKNVSILAFAEIFLKLKGLIMMPFITKYLGAMNYGIWSQVMVIVSLISPLVFFGMDNSLARFLPGLPVAEQRRDFTGWFLFGSLVSLLLLVLIYLLSPLISELFFGNDEQYTLFVVLAGLNIVTTSLLTGIRNWFRIQNNALFLSVLTLLQGLLQTLILIVILIKKQGIYELVLWSLLIDALLISFYIFYFFKTKVFSKPSFEWLKPYFKFGIIFLPSGYAIWILNSLDRVFLAQYYTLSDIGIYSICFTIGYTLIQVIVNPIWNLFPTKAAELYNQNKPLDLTRLFNQSIKLICWIIFPSMMGFLIVGEEIMNFLSTTEFSKGYLTIPIILAGYLFLMLSAYFETILTLNKKPYLSTLFTILACVVNIALNFMLIPRFSYIGAAVATSLSFAIQLMTSIFYVLHFKLINFDIKPIIKITLASLSMFLIALLTKKYWITLNGFGLILGLSFVGGLSYIFLTFIFRIYSFRYFIEKMRLGFSYG